MIEKPKNGVSHPKNDLLKKIYDPQIFLEFLFFTKLYNYNDRKTQKSGKPTQKWLNDIMKDWWIVGIREWHNKIMEWWNEGMMEWWNDGMTEWWNFGMMEWKNGRMMEWWRDGRMMEWCINGIIKWGYDRVTW